MAITALQATVNTDRHETTLRDRFGNPIVTLRSFIRTEYDGLNEIKTQDYESIALIDGFMWNAAMLHSNPVVPITCCDLCRKPPWRLFRTEQRTHGLLTVENADECHRCGKTLCARHRVEFGPVIRCVPCARWRRLWNLILFLFTREG